ncbi:MAG: hypothetical protein J6L90_06835 [Clostridia bacterium]|nr:hypothetical protein [Clostridia bacterium]
MKTKICKSLAFALILALAISLVSCFGGVGSGKCTVVLAVGDEVKEYTVELDKVTGDDGLMPVLRYLNENEGVALDYTESTYGAMLKSVGIVVPDATRNEYVKIYTSNTLDFDTSTYFEELEYEGTRLGTSGLGASGMTVDGGGIYYLTVGSFG